MSGSTALCWTLAGGGGGFHFLDLFYTVGRTPWTGDQPVKRPLPAHRTRQTQNKRTQTSMPQVGFEPTIPEFERAKIASDFVIYALANSQLNAYEVK
jgi:hypothetical protein